MTRYSDRLLPVAHYRLDAVYCDRRAEYGAVEYRTDGAVRALPHLVQVILGHTLGIRCDGGALYAYAVLLDRFSRVFCDLIARLIADRKSEVVIFSLEVDERQDELILDHLPEYPCHLIPVHLDDRGGHSDLFHFFSLFISWFLNFLYLSHNVHDGAVARFDDAYYSVFELHLVRLAYY